MNMGGVGRNAGTPRTAPASAPGTVRDAVDSVQQIASSQKANKIKSVKLKVKFKGK